MKKLQLRKIVSFALVFSIFISILGYDQSYVSAENISEKGSCGENATYILYSDGTVSISGSGEVKSNAFASNDKIVKVIIESNISSLGSGAFSGCSSLKTVSLSSSVKSIGKNAFANCTSLKNVILNDGLEVIETNAFYNSGIEYITIPDTVKILGASSFGYCLSLKNVFLGKGVESIGVYAFALCVSLTEVEIPPNVVLIEDFSFGYDFSDCRIISVEITGEKGSAAELFAKENSFRFIEKTYNTNTDNSENNSGEKNGIYWDINSDGVLTVEGKGDIKEEYFASNNNIYSVVISDGIVSVGENAFKDCVNLKKISIGKDVLEIGSLAFGGCSRLLEICVSDENQHFSSENGILFNKDKTEIIKYPSAIEEDLYVIPQSVITVGEYSFEKAIYLFTITIGKNVQNIENGAFSGCVCLEKAEIPENVVSLGENSFSGCLGISSVYFGKGLVLIGDNAFRDCRNLISVSWNDSISSIGAYAFYGTNLPFVVVPKSVVFVGENAFGYTYTSRYEIKYNFIIYGENGSSAEKYADSEKIMFVESRLKPVGNIASTGYCGENAYYAYYEGNVIVVSGNGAIEEKAFHNKSYIEFVVIGDRITSVGASAFSFCDSLSYVELGNGVETIGKSAFTYCTSLTKITIPENVISIESGAFCNSGLSSVFIGDHVSFIGKSAFGNCESLTSITVDENNLYYSSKNGVLFNKDKSVLLAYPSGKTNSSYAISNSVTEIGESAFSNCKNLKAVILNDGLKTINGNAFYGCEGFTDISIPDSVEFLGDSAFGFCLSLRNVNLGKGLKSIGSYAFAFAWVKSVKIPPSVVQIGKMAFGYTFADEKISNVEIVGIGGTAAETFASEHNFPFTDLSEVNLNDEKLSVSDGIIRGVSEKTSVSELSGLLNAEEIIITDSNGNILETDEFIGTGSVVKIMAFGSAVNEITVVVNGDIDGNGEISITDTAFLKREFLDRGSLFGIYYKAADVDRDGALTIADYLRLKCHLQGKFDIYK